MADDIEKPENNEPKDTLGDSNFQEILTSNETVEVPEPTPVPAEVPTPEPTPVPVEVPTPEPTPTPISDQVAAPVEDVNSLKKQLEFYRLLYGEQPQVATKPADAPAPTNIINTQQDNKQQGGNLLDLIVPTKDELFDLLSGDPERTTPVLRRFAAGIIALSQQHIQQQQMQQERIGQYNTKCYEAFWEKYKADLDGYQPLVKYTGDLIQQEYAQKGIQKYPHEVIDEIGTRAIALKKQMIAGKQEQPKPTIRQGESGDLKTSPPPTQKLSEQQKDMLDLLIE